MGHSASDACMVRTLEYFQHILMCPPGCLQDSAVPSALTPPASTRRPARRRDRRIMSQVLPLGARPWFTP